MIGNWLKRATGAERVPEFSAKIAPDEPFFAIGDIHGNLRALEALFEKLNERDPKLAICVGDYVDRGDDSASVLDRLHHLNRLYPDTFMCLRGNHEDMLLNFLDAPEENGERWLRFGGLQTLLSFRVNRGPGESMTSIRDRLYQAMGEPLIKWLIDLPVMWQTGNVAVCHAGMDPEKPVESQSRQTLVWGHPKFGKVARADGIWTIHGHTIVDEPVMKDGVISIDTGAYATNKLTAVEVTRDEVNFIHS